MLKTTFVPIEEYMKLPREKRQEHLDLSAACVEWVGNRSDYFRGLLCFYLGTTMPSGMKILLCHACHNARCGNPAHLYLGLALDNALDYKASPQYRSGWEISLARHGEEKALLWMRKAGAAGGRANKGKPKSKEHREKLRVAAQQRYRK